MNADKRKSGKAQHRRVSARDKLANLIKRPGVIVGDPGSVAQARTFDETKWRKKWRKRLKKTGRRRPV